MMHVQAPFNPVGDHTGTATAGTVTLAKPTGAREVLIQCTSGTARFTFGTVNPGTATGFQLRAGDAPLIVPVVFGTAIKVAPESGTATIAYQWGG
jgi:hypothetical protein